MNLGECLTELRENILHDRSDQTDGPSDLLWTDTTLVRYIDEAQRRFARRAFVIRDGTVATLDPTSVTPGINHTFVDVAGSKTPVTQVPLVLGQNIYPLDPCVIAVLSAQVQGDNADLARAGHSSFQTYHMPDTYFFDPGQLSTMNPGKPLAYSTDEFVNADPDGSLTQVNLRIFPVVSVDYVGAVVNLRIIRMPINRLTLANMEQALEVPEQHHMDLLEWAAYLALRIVDVDAGMPERAQEFKNSFEEHVKEARNAMLRKMFVPQEWGFGRNGFSWIGN